MLYYHVNRAGLNAGDVIEPGHYGSGLLADGLSEQDDPLLELARENFRLTYHPNLPSRLRSVFFCKTEEQAVYYRDNVPYRKEDSVYSVRVRDTSVVACHGCWSIYVPKATDHPGMQAMYPNEYWSQDFDYGLTMEIFAVTELEAVAVVA